MVLHTSFPFTVDELVVTVIAFFDPVTDADDTDGIGIPYKK